ncbi:hypothetical protein, partial [Halovibrio sp. HP20-50]|uniref:hypothetical protein n=1 Tax=Halovibrio sp. HP20-59 TaxID=3080275 RepID=UPI00294B4494
SCSPAHDHQPVCSPDDSAMNRARRVISVAVQRRRRVAKNVAEPLAASANSSQDLPGVTGGRLGGIRDTHALPAFHSLP